MRWHHGAVWLLPVLALRPAPAATTFASRPPVASVTEQVAGVTTADMDGDGDMDVVTAEYANTVAWYRNEGGTPPTFTRRIVDPGASGPITVAAGDVDGDGDVDIFSANFNNEGIVWYQNPTWTKRVVSGFWVGAWGVEVADVDGDGDLDGIGGLTQTKCGPPLACPGVEWYDNDGSATPGFTARPVAARRVGANTVRAADVDGDGDLDILSVDTANDQVVWFDNDGAHPPGWTERLVTAAVDDPWGVFAADLDRDGDVDVLTASVEDDTVAWHENDGQVPPSFTQHVVSTANAVPMSIHAADFDGDGDMDPLVGTWDSAVLLWYENDGAAPPAFTEHVIGGCGGAESITAARLDGDADVDALCAENVGRRTLWWENQANYLDGDGDGVRDGLDCAPGNGGAFAIPPEIAGVAFSSRTSLRWRSRASASGTATLYDVLRGPLAALPVGPGSDEVCAADGSAATSLGAATAPLPGTGFYYLVRGSTVCGVGSYGLASAGPERDSNACP